MIFNEAMHIYIFSTSRKSNGLYDELMPKPPNSSIRSSTSPPQLSRTNNPCCTGSTKYLVASTGKGKCSIYEVQELDEIKKAEILFWSIGSHLTYLTRI